MAEFAKNVKLVLSTDGKGFLTVDGQEFPYHIHADTIETVHTAGEVPYVRFSLLAERLEVVAEFPNRPKQAEPSSLMGQVFKASEKKQIEDSVLVLLHEEADEDDRLKFLVRSRNGNWNWGISTRDVSDSGFVWENMSTSWRNDHFRVVKVRD